MSKAVLHTRLRFSAYTRDTSAIIRWRKLRITSLQRQWLLPIHTTNTPANEAPFRKHLKDEAKKERAVKRISGKHELKSRTENELKDPKRDKWKLTVGVEIHAQLNTEKKLFSCAETSANNEPNINIASFDLAYPGSQPEFQKATLIPALRAAAGFSCDIQRTSKFDRKHYHYQDQPEGYQITQYYEPFAKNGRVTLYDYDGIAPEDGTSVHIEIKQIQVEQDTAKSTLQPPSMALLDFNRVGHPLIEIITHPQIHHPQTAAACVKKIQAILETVDAVTAGMEMGGLRADVNVSVSPVDSSILGQRTEIKNLSSIRAVEDAIIAERDRQIAILEDGGSIIGETRGWNPASTETTRLRGKEGEVDYRYMPDPDISPLIIADELTSYIQESLPTLPDELIAGLVLDGLTIKDAKTLVSLDNGERLDYFNDVRLHWASHRLVKSPYRSAFVCLEDAWNINLRVEELTNHDSAAIDEVLNIVPSIPNHSQLRIDRIVANWTLHELGGLLSAANVPFSAALVPSAKLSDILINLYDGSIIGPNAKRLLAIVFDRDSRTIEAIINAEGLRRQPLGQDIYIAMAKTLLEENKEKVRQITEKKQLGKMKWFVGQMVRQGEGNVEAERAEKALKSLLGLGQL